jgi:hypothetical protein
MAGVMTFRRVVGWVFVSRMSSDIKFTILDLVADVKIAQFHRARALPFDCAIGNDGGGGVVTVNWCGWLGVS